METPKNLISALRWCDIDTGSSIPIESEEGRKTAFIDEFCWDEGLPRYLGYDDRILKLLFLN